MAALGSARKRDGVRADEGMGEEKIRAKRRGHFSAPKVGYVTSEMCLITSNGIDNRVNKLEIYCKYKQLSMLFARLLITDRKVICCRN